MNHKEPMFSLLPGHRTLRQPPTTTEIEVGHNYLDEIVRPNIN